MREFPKEYRKIQDMVLEAIAKTPLNPFPVNFEVVSYDEMNEIISYTGFPTRYPHWRFGMEYDRNTKMGRYGLQKVLELVINNDPSHAYLLEGSNLATIKLIMAHVYVHSDFFRNNFAFDNTNRKMVDRMGTNAATIQKIINGRGYSRVELFIENCLMIEDLIDPLFQQKKSKPKTLFEVDKIETMETPRLKSKDYMDSFINPQEFLDRQRKKMEDMKKKEKEPVPRPERDILQFMLKNAPLEKWEEKILSIIAEESYYFLPQKQTKIMNEGWATYWHSRLMTEHLLMPRNIMEDSELFNYADENSKILASSLKRINPYKLGVELYKHIAHLWDTGRHGHDYDACDDMERKLSWDTREMKGLEQILMVRKCYNDLMFIDEYFTEDFFGTQKYFMHEDYKGKRVVMSKDFEDVKNVLLKNLTNHGQPIIYVVDSNFKNRGELQLYHKWTGVPLKKDYAETTLKGIYKLWKRPVCIETMEIVGEKEKREKHVRIRFTGEKIEKESGSAEDWSI